MTLRRQLVLLFIRMAALGLRFVFFALFFRYSEALYGQYGLVAVSITLGTYLLGMEFYTYVQREWLRPGRELHNPFWHQLLFYAILYPLILPLFLLLFYYGFLDWQYAGWFFAVLVAEHLAMEVFRLLFLVGRPLWANVNLFLRNGLWVLPALWQMYAGGGLDIGDLLRYWFAGDLLALTTVLAARRDAWRALLPERKLQMQWIWRGWRIALPFFVAALSFKLVEFADRYVIDAFMNKVSLGVYTFFSNMAMLVNTVVYTAVISVLYPQVVKTLMNNDAGKPDSEAGIIETDSDNDNRTSVISFLHFRHEIRKWTWGAAIAALAGMPLLLFLLGKQNRLQYFDVFAVLVAANAIYNFSMAWHFVLYARRRDRLIVNSAVMAAVLNLVLNLVAVPLWGLRGAAWATLASMGLIWWLKWRGGRRVY